MKEETPVKKNLLEESKTLGPAINASNEKPQDQNKPPAESQQTNWESDLKYQLVGMKFLGDPKQKAPSLSKSNKSYPSILNGVSQNSEVRFIKKK